MKKHDMSKFYFDVGLFHTYNVTYRTGRGDYYESLIDYSNHLIDLTKNCNSPRCKDIDALRNLVKRTGKHYHKNGIRFGAK